MLRTCACERFQQLCLKSLYFPLIDSQECAQVFVTEKERKQLLVLFIRSKSLKNGFQQVLNGDNKKQNNSCSITAWLFLLLRISRGFSYTGHTVVSGVPHHRHHKPILYRSPSSYNTEKCQYLIHLLIDIEISRTRKTSAIVQR